MSTLSEHPRPERPPLPTARGRQTQAAIDAAARAVVARKGHPGDDGRGHRRGSRAVDGVVLQLLRIQRSDGAGNGPCAFRMKPDSAPHGHRARTDRPGARHQAVAAHWNTYRNRRAEMISVSQLATVNADFARYWAELCAVPLSFITGMVMRAQAQGHCRRRSPPHRGGAGRDVQPVLLHPPQWQQDRRRR